MGVVLALCLASIVLPAFAHKLKVFAFVAGDRIEGSTYFAGGGKARGAHIRIQDAQNNLLAELQPDSDGGFSYRVQAPVEHVVIASSADGHRAEWRIGAAELMAGFPAGQDVMPSASDAGQPALDAASTQRHHASTAGRDAESRETLDRHTIAAIEQAVARQLHPLREQLLAAQDRARLQDILGGIGYILGLTGLALWWHARSKGPRA